MSRVVELPNGAFVDLFRVSSITAIELGDAYNPSRFRLLNEQGYNSPDWEVKTSDFTLADGIERTEEDIAGDLEFLLRQERELIIAKWEKALNKRPGVEDRR